MAFALAKNGVGNGGKVAIVVLQSASDRAPPWVKQCLARTKRWATANGYDYTFIGDALFERVPVWYRDKLVNRGPIIADLARLVWAREVLNSGAEAVVWLDADTWMTDLSAPLNTDDHTRFGVEHWVQPRKNGRGLEARRNIHNAFAYFSSKSPVLDFLALSTESIIRRADPNAIAPQMVGPKLIKALHSLADFAVEERASALSPLVVEELRRGDTEGEALATFSKALVQAPVWLNLCTSLQAQTDSASMIKVCVKLDDFFGK